MSKSAQNLANNLESLIGPGKRFSNDREAGERTGIGQRQVHRFRTMEVDPKLSSVDAISERLHLPAVALISPGMDALEGALPEEIKGIVRRIVALANERDLQSIDLMHLEATISLIERTKQALPLVSETRGTQTGT